MFTGPSYCVALPGADKEALGAAGAGGPASGIVGPAAGVVGPAAGVVGVV